MNENILEKYARLILKVGINLQSGQNLVIKGDACHWDFATILQKVAYQNNAAIIKTELTPPTDLTNRVKYQNEQYLNLTPSYLEHEIETHIREKWAFIRLEGSSDPDAYESLDQSKNAIIEKAYREKFSPLFGAYMNGNCHWTIAPVPTRKWAEKIYGSDGSNDNTRKLWETLIPILRLDQENPTLAWQKHNEMLERRIAKLEQFNLEYLHFQGPQTDLKIHLSKHSAWAGGCFKDAQGVPFNPNLPTEEIFTTPDYHKTSGCILITRPVLVLGKYVENAWFEFHNGQVVNYKATKNIESLNKYFEIDHQARYLGEVALVDLSSPISKTNTIFHSILLDENASCHIALGRGITAALKNCGQMTKEELDAIGCNMSLLHTDFMVGSKELNVDGYCANGRTINIIKDGHFAI